MKFATKITLSVAVVSLIAVPALVFSTFYFARTVLQKNIAKNHLEIAKHQMQAIDRALYTAYRDIQIIAEDDVLQLLLEPQAEVKEEKQEISNRSFSELEEHARLSGPWDLLMMIDTEGTIITSTDKESVGKHIDEYPASSTTYHNALKGRTDYSDLVLSSIIDRPTVMFAAPIRSEWGKSSINGVVLGHFAWPVVLQALDDIAPPVVARLINSEGMTIAAPKAHTDDIFKLNRAGLKLAQKASESGVSGSTSFESGSHDGRGAVLAVSSLQNGYFGYKGSDWSLLLEVPLEKALAPVNRMARHVAAVAVVVMMVMISVLYYLGRLLARPVERLTETVEEVSGGKLTVQADVTTKDEVGELASSFNRMTEALQRTTVSRDYVDNILKTMPGTLIIMTPDTVIESVNQAALDLLGYEEKELIGQSIHFILAEEEAALLEKSPTGLLSRNGYVSNVEKFYSSKDGRKIPVLFSGTIMCDSEGKKHSIVSVAIDISQRKEHEEKLRRTSRALGAIHASNILLVRSDDEQRLLEGVCHNIVEQTGYRFAWVGLRRPDDAGVILPVAWAGKEQGYIDSLQRCLRVDEMISCPEATAIRTGAACIEMDISSAPGSLHWRKQAAERGYKSVIVFPLMREEEAFGALAIYSTQANTFQPDEVELLQELADDLAYGVTALRTRQKHQQAEQLIAYQASHDALTDLPNRSTIMQSLSQTINQLRHQGGAVAVLFIDLDEFKLVNDTLGHAAGDELLRQAAERMKSATRDADIIARQGGDEFIVLLAKYGEQIVKTDFEQLAATVAQRILDGLQEPFRVQGQEAYVSASIGISLLPGDTDDAAQLIQYADHAMYRAKELGRNNYQYFCKELSERQQKKMSLATKLHKAIEQQEFRLHYQPLIDLDNGRLVGVEALIRWEQEEGHLVSPADFLPVAEDTGLILPIGDWVVREACRQLREWADKGISLTVAINLSARQMWHGDIAHQILNIINETGISRNMLEIEVTESAMIIEPERMAETLEHFDENEIKISLDDFGTGYSSLDRLKHLPFNKLKIDKSFVDGIPDDEDDIAIVTATVQMARNLKLYSLAEGIETVEQYRFLKNLGCNYGQGYYFSRPVPATEIECMFKQNRHWELKKREFNGLSPDLIEG
ncbi:EAL domain-containing protein [Amphritea sp. HPY]|uniref:EAL domain-containing protein n=1 Tax=Amphritea sp. HPY TaxID=3421652 RepID=UPI003D7DDCEF